MKLNMKQIQSIVSGMDMLSEDIKAGKLKLEYGTSLTVAVTKKKLAPVYEGYTELRDALLEEMCVKDERGQKCKIPAKTDAEGNIVVPEQWDLGGRDAEWKAEVKKLLLEEQEIERLEPFPLASFKIKKVKGTDGKEEEGDINPEILFLLVPWLVLES